LVSCGASARTIVFGPLPRVTQYLVRFVQLSHPLGGVSPSVDVGVVFPRETLIGGLDDLALRI